MPGAAIGPWRSATFSVLFIDHSTSRDSNLSVGPRLVDHRTRIDRVHSPPSSYNHQRSTIIPVKEPDRHCLQSNELSDPSILATAPPPLTTIISSARSNPPLNCLSVGAPSTLSTDSPQPLAQPPRPAPPIESSNSLVEVSPGSYSPLTIRPSSSSQPGAHSRPRLARNFCIAGASGSEYRLGVGELRPTEVPMGASLGGTGPPHSTVEEKRDGGLTL